MNMFPIPFVRDLQAPRCAALLCVLACAFAATDAVADGQVDGVAEARSVTSVMVAGTAIADYWVATPAEYAATAESILDAVGAPDMRRGTVAGSIAAELLTMFAGGGGAPQDVVKLGPVVPSSLPE